ncbi:hypothetical protein OROHE_005784 [Orobanche hederae]
MLLSIFVITIKCCGCEMVEDDAGRATALAIKLVDSTLLMNNPIQVILSPFHHDSSPSVVFIKAQFSQMCPVTVTSPGAALPVYPLPLPIHSPPAMYALPGPGFAHKMLYPQALPTLFPLQSWILVSSATFFLVCGSMRPPVGAPMPKPIFQIPRENLYPLVDQACIVMQLRSLKC